MTLLITPISAGPDCIDNNQNFIQCDCNCEIIPKKRCIDCRHLQNARPITIIESHQISQNNTKQTTQNKSRDPQEVLNKLAARYLQNK